MASDVKCVVSVFICNEGETLIKYFDFDFDLTLTCYIE